MLTNNSPEIKNTARSFLCFFLGEGSALELKSLLL